MNKEIKIVWICAVITVILCIIVAMICVRNAEARIRKENIVIPKIANGIVYGLDENIAIIKLNLKDDQQKMLLQQITLVCNKLGITECQGF